jgi:uncharacterized protein
MSPTSFSSSSISPKTNRPKLAVIGSGITGLGAALELSSWSQVTLIEQDRRLGGHSNAVDVSLDGITHPVDTGFLVFNDRTYPNLIKLFAQLDVPIAQTDMSFAISLGPYQYEWCGSNRPSQALAQPSNAFKPRFWKMLRDMFRFNKAATELAAIEAQGGLGAHPMLHISLGEYLDKHQYSQSFRQDYLLPMAAAIWSCPMSQIMAFPMHTFVRFCDNHGLLQVNNRPKWRTVAGSSREYVKRIEAALLKNGATIKLANPVSAVKSIAKNVVQVQSTGADGRLHNELFDGVLLATHSDQTKALMSDASTEEGAYEPNRAFLHTDKRLMPKRQRAWAAWNYMGKGSDAESEALSVTYWCNQLQPLPFETPVFVTLNPIFEPDPKQTLREIHYAHPIFDQAAVQAQQKLAQIQGQRGLWFAGAWAGYGFHEDGLKSGLNAAGLMQDHFMHELLLNAA